MIEKVQDSKAQDTQVEQRMFDFFPDSVFLVCEGKIALVNDKAMELADATTNNELVGKTLDSAISIYPDHQNVLDSILDQLNKGDCIPPTKLKIEVQGGKLADVELVASPYVFKGRHADMFIIRKLNKRKTFEKDNLYILESRYKKVTELSPNAILIECQGEIVYANKAAIGLLNKKDVYEVVGRPILTLLDIHPDYQQVVNERLIQLQQPDTTLPFLEQKIIVDGKVMDVEISAASFNIKGKLNTIISIKDITESKIAEECEKRLVKDIENERMKNEFFSNLSHELKTPLNIILATIQLVQSAHCGISKCPIDIPAHRYIKLMRQNCYRLLRLINNLIDMTKIDLGHTKMDFKNCNIVNLIEDIVLSVVEYTKTKDIKLIFDTDIEEKIIACDRDKIERVLLNLLSNAVKFTSPGGTIWVNIQGKQDKIVVCVKDNGIGIAENMKEQIFERFKQGEPVFTSVNQGSGIGLSLVKSIIQSHGGTIRVESIYGQGSEFIIELPVKVLDEQEINKKDYLMNNGFILQDNVERINIEFSDIYS